MGLTFHSQMGPLEWEQQPPVPQYLRPWVWPKALCWYVQWGLYSFCQAQDIREISNLFTKDFNLKPLKWALMYVCLSYPGNTFFWSNFYLLYATWVRCYCTISKTELFSKSESCLVVSDSLQPHDYTVHGIVQARILEWVAFPLPGDLPNPGVKPGSPTLLVDSLPAEPPARTFL